VPRRSPDRDAVKAAIDQARQLPHAASWWWARTVTPSPRLSRHD
jgi:hypothetical protein